MENRVFIGSRTMAFLALIVTAASCGETSDITDSPGGAEIFSSESSSPLALNGSGLNSIYDCATVKGVLDAKASYKWSSSRRAGDDIENTINRISEVVPKMKLGALHSNQDNANFFCQLNGYAFGAIAKSGAFASPADNFIYRWDSKKRSFNQFRAVTDNRTITALSCSQKLIPQCTRDRRWIFEAPKSSISFYSTSLPQVRENYRVGRVGDKVYFIGGGLPETNYQEIGTEIYVLDLSTMKVTTAKSSLPNKRQLLLNFTATFGSKIVLSSNCEELVIYDTKMDTIYSEAIPKEAASSCDVMVAAGSQLIIAGSGWKYNFESNKYETVETTTANVYDLEAGKWSKLSLPGQRAYVQAKSSERNVYFVGPTGIDIFNLAEKSWSTRPSVFKNSIVLTGSRAAFVTESYASYLGGQPTDSFDVYDERSKQWSVYKFPVIRRDGYSAYGIGDQLFFTMGKGIRGSSSVDYSGGRLIDVFDLNKKSWFTGSLATPRFRFEVASIGGFGVFSGGQGPYHDAKIYDSIDIYESASGKWSGAKLSQARMVGSTVVVGNKVVFVGGYSNDGYSAKIDIIEVK